MPAFRVLMRRTLAFCCFALAALLTACGDSGSSGGMSTGPDAAFGLRLEQVGSALGLDSPVFVGAPPDDKTRLFVVEKAGVIKIIDLTVVPPQVLPTPFIDLKNQINSNGEQGLLGLAFHPNFSVNRFFYVYLSNLSGDSEVRRYTVPIGTPNVADPMSVQLIISVSQPAATNHKAGWLGFGLDGFLYIALGDGGSTPGNGQDLSNLLGKILRLDVDSATPYAIPPGNPFAGASPERDEIWSYGLRNPFRVSFDRLTGDFYIADVGQSTREEVNVSTLASGGGAGTNYGWDIMEGSLCFNPMMGCSTGGLARPILEYDHTQGCSITGGYVYRGTAIPALQGTYFYGDFCQGFVRSFKLVNDQATEQKQWPLLDPGVNLTSFGEDAAGELYITTLNGGLFRIVQ